MRIDADTLCSVIYVKKTDGLRVPFDDDTRLNLESRAYKLGTATGQPTAVTRRDEADDTRPVEGD